MCGADFCLEGSVADPDPGSGIRCLFDPWIGDLGWVKNQNPDPGSGSRMNIPDHMSESLESIFGLKYCTVLRFLCGCGSGSGIRNLFDPGSGIREKHPRSGTLLHGRLTK
jgi:hypothetical protein